MGWLNSILLIFTLDREYESTFEHIYFLSDKDDITNFLHIHFALNFYGQKNIFSFFFIVKLCRYLMRLSFFDIRNHGYFFWTLITVMSNYFFLLSRLTTAWPWPTDQWSSRSSASSRRAYRTYREGGTVLCTIKNPVKMAWGTIFFVWHPFPFPPPQKKTKLK